MRKTRLVIQPTRCLHTIGFLLLYMSCPVIGDWGLVQPDTATSHRAIALEREGARTLIKDPPTPFRTNRRSDGYPVCDLRDTWTGQLRRYDSSESCDTRRRVENSRRASEMRQERIERFQRREVRREDGERRATRIERRLVRNDERAAERRESRQERVTARIGNRSLRADRTAEPSRRLTRSVDERIERRETSTFRNQRLSRIDSSRVGERESSPSDRVSNENRRVATTRRLTRSFNNLPVNQRGNTERLSRSDSSRVGERYEASHNPSERLSVDNRRVAHSRRLTRSLNNLPLNERENTRMVRSATRDAIADQRRTRDLRVGDQAQRNSRVSDESRRETRDSSQRQRDSSRRMMRERNDNEIRTITSNLRADQAQERRNFRDSARQQRRETRDYRRETSRSEEPQDTRRTSSLPMRREAERTTDTSVESLSRREDRRNEGIENRRFGELTRANRRETTRSQRNVDRRIELHHRIEGREESSLARNRDEQQKIRASDTRRETSFVKRQERQLPSRISPQRVTARRDETLERRQDMRRTDSLDRRSDVSRTLRASADRRIEDVRGVGKAEESERRTDSRRRTETSEDANRRSQRIQSRSDTVRRAASLDRRTAEISRLARQEARTDRLSGDIRQERQRRESSTERLSRERRSVESVGEQMKQIQRREFRSAETRARFEKSSARDNAADFARRIERRLTKDIRTSEESNESLERGIDKIASGIFANTKVPSLMDMAANCFLGAAVIYFSMRSSKVASKIA